MYVRARYPGLSRIRGAPHSEEERRLTGLSEIQLMKLEEPQKNKTLQPTKRFLIALHLQVLDCLVVEDIARLPATLYLELRFETRDVIFKSRDTIAQLPAISLEAPSD